MNEKQLKYYEAGILDAQESKKICVAYQSKRYAELSKMFEMKIGEESLKCLTAYDKGVAFEINRQTKLLGDSAND